MKALSLLAATVAIIVTTGGISWARQSGGGGQTPGPDPKQKLAQAQKANAAELKQYTWKSRTEMKLKGETKKVKVEQVTYDATGQRQKTVLEENPPPGAQDGGHGGALMQKLIAKKKQEATEKMQNLVKLLTSYTQIPPERMQAFVKNAEIGRGEGAYEGTLNVTGQNAVQDGDTMSIWIDRQSLLIRRLEINTFLDNKPVSLTTTHQVLPQGPTFLAQATLDYPAQNLQVLIENSDFQLQQSSIVLAAQTQPAPVPSQPGPPAGTQGTAQQSRSPSSEQLDKLLAPIALYPDALVAQILTCAASPFQVKALSDWLSANSNLKGSELQEAAQKEGFDPSFVALAVFPQVVTMMARDIDWTRKAGQAFNSDRKSAFDSVQRLRSQAQEVGNLKTTQQQEVETVTTDSGQQVIVIQPANPQVVYVPQYNPQTVYVTPPPAQPTTSTAQSGGGSGSAVAAGVIGFTAGVIIGAAASDNYYHGPYAWRGGAAFYNDAWDDYYDHRENMADDYYDHRENMSDNRQETYSQRQDTRSQNVDERQGSRNQNVDERQGSRNQNVEQRQGSRNQNVDARQTSRGQNQTSRQSSRSSGQYAASSRSSSYAARGRSESARSGRSSGFSGYGNASRERSASSRGHASRSSSGSGRTRRR